AGSAARLRTRRRGCCVTDLRSLPRGADRRRGFSDLRTAIFMIALPAMRASFALDIGGLDDGPPLLDFGFLQCGESLGCLLVFWKNLLPEVAKPSPHSWVAQSINDG